MKSYRIPKTFPKPLAGSAEALGLDDGVCFERYTRYGPYGFGREDSNVEDWVQPSAIRWDQVDWGKLQEECFENNMMRYPSSSRIQTKLRPSTDPPIEDENNNDALPGNYRQELRTHREIASASTVSRISANAIKEKSPNSFDTLLTAGGSHHHRTAVLIRTWTGYKYTSNDVQALRAMITELSLTSGGEYQVFLFLHAKSTSKETLADDVAHQRLLDENIPREFHNNTIIWAEDIFRDWYPEVTDWQVYWHQFMCLQWFSKTHPEFDYIWNWETDARYTGNHYHFLEKMADFSKKQPRKLLWERNKRYYIPSVHGSYTEFVADTHTSILDSASKGLISQPIWGPSPQLDTQTPIGPKPPHSQDEDEFTWGVNEEADLITTLPIWDPVQTKWDYRNMIWNFIPGIHPVFTQENPAHFGFNHPNFTQINRRVVINTQLRFSKRMLHAMHLENLAGRSMQAEMWPATVALHHGLKAVYAPHPTWSDRVWPHPYSDLVFNANGGVPGAWGEREDSIYAHDREYNFFGWSWYYASRFPRVLYRRWLGMDVAVQPWGEEEKVIHQEEAERKGGVGRMCLPGMLLHPVKRMDEGAVKL
jgi:hypothetical protein